MKEDMDLVRKALTKAAHVPLIAAAMQQDETRELFAQSALDAFDRLADFLHADSDPAVQAAKHLSRAQLIDAAREAIYLDRGEENPFDPESPEGRAWEAGDRSSIAP